ncbi:MAG TPA: hypothetical protein VGH84_14440 [Steroidobacteraceae bacterium]
MPGSATLFTEQQVLGHTLRFAPMTVPAGTFMALCAVAPPPTAAVGGIEVTGGGYVRLAAVFALATTPPNIAANTATLEFPAATTNWGGLGFFEIWSALSGGNRLYWGPLVDPVDGITPITRTVLSGDIVRFSAGLITVQAT